MTQRNKQILVERGSRYDGLTALFNQLRMPCPPVPTFARPQMRWVDSMCWATHDLSGVPALHDRPWHAGPRSILGALDRSFVAVKLDQCDRYRLLVTYVAHHGPLAMFVQHAIGDAERAGEGFSGVLSGIADVLRAVDDLGLAAPSDAALKVTFMSHGLELSTGVKVPPRARVSMLNGTHFDTTHTEFEPLGDRVRQELERLDPQA